MIKKITLILFILALSFASAALADTVPEKLGRGVANIATGWLEVPVQVVRTSEQEGALSGMTVGVVKGVFCAVGRTVSGAFDVLSCPAPDVKPLAEPDFVFSDRDGAYEGF